MPDVTLSGIEFTIKGSADSASNSVKKLTDELEGLKKALSDAGHVKTLATNLTKLNKSLSGLSSVDSKGASKALNNIGKSLKKLESVSDVSKNLASFARAMNSLAANKDDRLTTLTVYLERIAKIDFSNLEKAGAALRNIADATRQISRGGGSGNSGGKFGWLKSLADGMWRIDKLTLKGIGKLGLFGAKGLGGLVSFPFKEATKNIGSMTKGITGVIGGFKRIAGYRILRSIIKEITQGFAEGTKNLYEWSRAMGGAAGANGKTFAQTMDSLATSMQYLKNSIGACVGPLINALAPAIEYVVDRIVALLNVINQLLAKLAGASSWNRAKKNAVAYGGAVEGAGEAAKEALRYLAPFDELNVLPDQKDNNSGGGGGGTDYSDMFEEVTEFNQAISDFADAIREKVANGDWQGLGELLGNKVNEVIDSIDWSGYGTKIGTFVNAWFTTQYWTLETINFQNLGGRIAELFNSAMEQIDFDIVGRALTQKFTIVGDLLIGAFNEVDWALVGTSIGNLFKGAFNQMSEWIEGIDWDEFGANFYIKLKELLEGLDFVGIAESIIRFLGAALSAATSIIREVVSGLVTDIKGYFFQFIEDENEDGNFGAGEIANGIIKGLENGVTKVGQWIDKQFGGKIKSSLVDPIKKLFDSISWGNLKIAFKTDLSKFKLPDLKSFKKLWDSVKNRTITMKAYLKGTALNTFNSLKNTWAAFKNKTATLKSYLENHVNTSVIDKLKSAWNSISSRTATFTAKLNLPSIWSGFVSAWNYLQNKSLELKVSIADSIRSAWNAAASAWNSSSVLSKLGTLPYLASGGIISDGVIRGLPQYANGTSNAGGRHGSLFVAGEAGPEIVGHVGGRTEVLNQSQIAASIQAGVARAINSASFSFSGGTASYANADTMMDGDTIYNAVLRAINDADNDQTIELDGDVIYQKIVQRNRQEKRRLGVNPMMAV